MQEAQHADVGQGILGFHKPAQLTIVKQLILKSSHFNLAVDVVKKDWISPLAAIVDFLYPPEACVCLV